MENFLEELRAALEKIEGVDVESVINKYKEHFALGHEAGMTDEEIIERFDSIDEIIKSLQQTEEDHSDEPIGQGFTIILDIGQFSDFTIETSDKPFGVKFELDEDATKYVEIIRKEKEIHLKSKYMNNIKKPNDFSGTLLIGYQEKINSITINGANCDIDFDCSLDCTSFSLTTISGDVSNLDVHATEKIYINSVNADFDINRLVTPNCQISTVNGDIEIEEFVCDRVKISTVHGDIHIYESNEAKYNINTVAGDVVIDRGAKPEDVRVSCVSGSVKVAGKSLGKTIGEIIRNSIKF